VGKTTKIAWCTATWNPVSGCRHVSPGCDHCYAERMAARFKETFGPVTTAGKWNGSVHESWPRRYQPKEWVRPRRIFVCSMSDLFHCADFASLSGILMVMKDTPRHTYYVLTKRVETAEKILDRASNGCLFSGAGIGWPFPNVWVGVSAETQLFFDARARRLVCDVKAAHRFVSCEPLLGPIDLRHRLRHRCDFDGGIEWVICGGENGPGARPMELDWARSLRDQCAEAKIPFFYKGGGAGKDDVIDGRVHHEIPEAKP
jgi:protein gp37